MFTKIMDETTMQVKETLAEKLGVKLDTLKEDISFAEDLGVDSLDVMETFMEMEKQFKITINDEDAEKLKTVGSLIEYIKQQIR